jgi:type IX secretion system PorP/SprF family membrane protein
MKKVAAVCFVSLAMMSTFGQQDPLYSQYLLNPFIINPAYAGFAKNLTALVSNRSQWSGLDGSPTTANASLHFALAKNKMGLGFTALKDEIGTNKITEAHAAYAYRIEMENKDRISFGLHAGAVSYRDDFSVLTIDPADPKFQKNISEVTFSFGAGVIYSSDRLLAGISMPKMLSSKSEVNGSEIVLYSQHAYGHLAYIFDLTHQIKVKPFVMARYVKSAPISLDLGGSFTFKDSYTMGLFTRSLHTFGMLAKINLGDMLRLGYVFELPTGKSPGVNYTAHEITIGIQTKIFKFHELFSVADF